MAVAEVCERLADSEYAALSSGDKRKFRDRVKGFLYRQCRKGWIEKRDAKFKLVIDEFFENV